MYYGEKIYNLESSSTDDMESTKMGLAVNEGKTKYMLPTNRSTGGVSIL